MLLYCDGLLFVTEHNVSTAATERYLSMSQARSVIPYGLYMQADTSPFTEFYLLMPLSVLRFQLVKARVGPEGCEHRNFNASSYFLPLLAILKIKPPYDLMEQKSSVIYLSKK